MNATVNKIRLIDVARGTAFNFGGHRWTVLDHDSQGRTLALTSNPVCNRAFDTNNHNDWRKSSLRKWLNDDSMTGNGFLYRIASALMKELGTTAVNLADYILPDISELTADDGMKDYGTCEDNIRLLSCDLYREYRDVIPPLPEDWWWTLTPRTCRASYYFYVRLVSTTGVLSSIKAYVGSRGVRPLCTLKSEILVSTEEGRVQEV